MAMYGRWFSYFVLVLPCAIGCDVGYDFGDKVDTVATEMKVTLTWWSVTPKDHAAVYMSTATGTACNSGYFGAQFHHNGETSLLFSMWDSPATFKNNSEFVFQGLPASKNCRRNALDASGKSTGVQCSPGINGEKVHLALGVPYVFTFGIIGQNKSGAMWEVSMFDTKNQTSISIGKIFFVDAPMGLPTTCRTLGRRQNPPTSGLSSYTFQEYFAQPRDYLTAATWGDMKIKTSSSDIVRPKGINGECCDHGDYKHGDHVNGTSSTCLPPECESPGILFTMGPNLMIPQKVLDANPSCLGSAHRNRFQTSADCWSGESIPDSLDDCFTRSASTKQQTYSLFSV